MNKALRAFFYCSLLLISGCHSKKGLQNIEWKKGESRGVLRSLEGLETSSSSPVVSSDQIIEIREQTFSGIPVEGSYIKRLRHSQGEEILVRAAVSFEEEKMLSLRLADYQKKKATVVEDLKAAFPLFRRSPPEKVEVVIAQRRGFYEPLWRILYTDASGVTWQVKMNDHLQVQGVQRMGSSFQEALAVVFPKGPKLSTLQEVTLRGLAVHPALSSTRLIVTSQAEEKIADVSGALKFTPQDARFDQVQVFYFLDEALNWFEKKLKVKIPFQLQAEVHVGAPEKTNAAFYYQGKIRFGTGDDEVYSRIPQDPSIVMHESAHALVQVLASLPFEGEGGSLNEAFADFFTALHLDNPHMGEVAYLKGPFRRTLVNDLKLKDKYGGLYHDSGIISGLLWSVRKKIGADKAQMVALLTLNRLTPGSDFVDFGVQLQEVLPQVLSAEEVKAVSGLIRERGF
ncbi:MAG: hypothetical protein AAGB31_11425 [Bdellovibrio sp.]